MIRDIGKIGFVIAFLATFLSATGLACSNCARDIVSASEFDAGAWDEASVVFVATIIVSRLAEETGNGGSREVEYEYQIEEVYKGAVDRKPRLYSHRTLTKWAGELDVISCGDVVVGAGDRVLVFSDGASDVYFGRCTAS